MGLAARSHLHAARRLICRVLREQSMSDETSQFDGMNEVDSPVLVNLRNHSPVSLGCSFRGLTDGIGGIHGMPSPLEGGRK